jgi:transposase
MENDTSYPAANISDDFKTHLARLYLVQHKKGKSSADFVNDLSEAGLVVSPRQFYRWVARVDSDNTAISNEKLSGNEKVLDRENRDVTSGWVLEQLEIGEEVHLKTYCDFVFDKFGINISLMTAGNYLKEDGFTPRTLQKKSASFIIDHEQLRLDLWNWVKSRQLKMNNIIRTKLCSIDFTFTGHRTERRKGFGIKGGSQPMESSKISKYTNCIITCIWADGKNRTPPMLFTLNPKFCRDRKPTQLRDEQRDHLIQCLSHYAIHMDRVVYVGKDKGETEQYTKESPKLLRLFFEHYDVPDDATILSDNGNAFYEDGVSVLEQVGFKNHDTYPANVHQYLSMNDNRLHGTGKQEWRNSGLDHSDDVKSCLALLSYLDQNIIKWGKYWFNRNVLELQESQVAELISSSGKKKCHLHKSWMRAYRNTLSQNDKGL